MGWLAQVNVILPDHTWLSWTYHVAEDLVEDMSFMVKEQVIHAAMEMAKKDVGEGRCIAPLYYYVHSVEVQM